MTEVENDKKDHKKKWEPPKSIYRTTKSKQSLDKNPDENDEEIEDEEIEFFDMKITTNQKELKKAWLAAKKLVNLGELSKAMAQFKTVGIAQMTPKIIE